MRRGDLLPGGLTFRPFEAGDLESVVPWFADEGTRRWLGGPDWPACSFRLADGEARHFLAVCRLDCVVGLVDIEIDAEARAYLAIAIAPSSRRLGVASLVLRTLETRPQFARVTAFVAGVHDDNQAGERLVLKAGFVQATAADEDGFRDFVKTRTDRAPWHPESDG